MITIDLNQEHDFTTGKPLVRKTNQIHLTGGGLHDPILTVVKSRQAEILSAVHTEWLLKSARNGGLPIDVQRFFENRKENLITLAERYLSRAR